MTVPAAARDWDARTYDRISDPHQDWAEQVLDRLSLRGDETVMDAGCGSGRVTVRLLQRLPRGRVFGVDASPAMLAVAREQLTVYGDRVTLLQADLSGVRLPEPIDAVFSNATFHWIPDHQALFNNLASLLRPGGRLVAQCGGAGNIDAMRRFADRVLAQEQFCSRRTGLPRPWQFAGPQETRTRLEAAGFTEIETWLMPEPAVLPDREAFVTFLETVILGPYLSVLPEHLHPQFVDAVAEEDDRAGALRTVDYVRLNLSASRPPA
jgi:trans-aconitate 2-methyltransferase